MKTKNIFMSLCLLAVAITAQAEDVVTFVSGDAKALSQPYTALVTIDYSNTVVDSKNEPTLNEYLMEEDEDTNKNWSDGLDKSGDKLASTFNGYTRKWGLLTLTTNPTQATHELRIVIEEVGMGAGFRMITSAISTVKSKKSGGASIKGTIELLDKKGSVSLCKLAFGKISGEGAFTLTNRMGNVYTELGNELIKYVKKNGANEKQKQVKDAKKKPYARPTSADMQPAESGYVPAACEPVYREITVVVKEEKPAATKTTTPAKKTAKKTTATRKTATKKK